MQRIRGALASRLIVLVISAVAVVAVIPAAGSARVHASPFVPRVGTIGGIVPVLGLTSPGVQGSGDLTYHGGPVMRTNTTYAIYWAPSGHPLATGYSNTIDQYFTDVAHDSGGTNNVYGVDTQYSDGTGNIAYSSSFAGSVVDTNPYPANGCTDLPHASICLTDAQLQNEIKSVVNAQGWPKNGTTMYFLYTPEGVGSCFDGSSTACSYSYYCAYHSSFSASGTIIYANQPYAAVPGCDPGQRPNGNVADATLNVTSHEHNEAITDWAGNAWYDAAGYENGDKCNFDFGSFQGPGGAEYNQTINGHNYFLQREYDNMSHSCLQRPGAATPATVTSLKPNALGQGAKGAKVTVRGTNFVSGATVSVSGSGVTVSSVTWVGFTTLSVKLSVAAGAATGSRDVSVTNPGAAAGTCTGCLTIDPGPLVASVVPPTGAHGASNVSVKILGANFANGAKVKFNSGINVVSHTFVNSGEIDATVSIASTAKLGGHPVTVTNPDKGVGTLSNAFTVT